MNEKRERNFRTRVSDEAVKAKKCGLEFLQELEIFKSAKYHGFTLKKGFWYGYDRHGNPIATSSWVQWGYLIIYVKKAGSENWHMDFIPKEHWNLLPTKLYEKVLENEKANLEYQECCAN